MIRDFRLTLRSLLRAPAFTIVIIATLAIGIGPTTAIFSIVDSLLLRKMPYRDPDSLVNLWRARQPGERTPVSGPDAADFQHLSRSFSDMAMTTWSGNVNIGDVSEPLHVDGAKVTPNYFALLGVQPLHGRLPLGSPIGGEKLVILGEDLWTRSYGARTDVIGTTTRLNGEPHRIVAVMPRDFSFAEKADLWVPFDPTPDTLGHRAYHQYRVVARLKPGVSLAHADAEVHAIAKRLGAMYPDTTAGIDALLTTVRDSLVGNVRKPLLVLFGAVVFLLLIACSNAANLLMTRAAAREREVAVRAALGAGERRLARELLTETFILTISAALIGLGIATLGLRVARSLGGPYFARPDLITIDTRVLLFNFAVAVVTGIVFGLAPLAARRDRFEHLKSGVRTNAQKGWNSRVVRESIVVAVIALSFVLLIGAGVLIHSFLKLREIAIGVDSKNLVTMQLFLPPARYPDFDQRARITQQVLRELRGMPGIVSAASIGVLPTENTTSGDIAFPNEKQFVDARRIASFSDVSPGFFHAAGVPFMTGRDFNDDDVRNAMAENPPAIINMTMATRFWPGKSPVGEVVLVGGEAAYRIVGVVGDVKQLRPSDPTPSHVYLPLGTPLPLHAVALIVRTTLAPAAVVADVRRVMAGIDPEVPPYRVRTMEDVIANAFAGPRFQTVVLVAFAATALFLALIGIYGVISYSVVQRTREIGIRMATGASRVDVLRLIVGRVWRLAAIGIGIGGVTAIALSHTLESLLFEVDVVDPRVFAAVAVLLLLTAAAASAVPARRAASVEPSISLRYD